MEGLSPADDVGLAGGHHIAHPVHLGPVGQWDDQMATDPVGDDRGAIPLPGAPAGVFDDRGIPVALAKAIGVTLGDHI